jgi:hypothetical protein
MTMAATDDDTPRDALESPSAEELKLVDDEFRANPLDVWRQRQTWLQELGHSPGRIDGIAGPNTIAALQAFQRAAGLRDDGKWGPRTQAAVDARLGRAPVTAAAPTPPASYEDFLGPVVLDQDFWDSFVDLSAKSATVLDEKGRPRRKGSRPGAALKRIVWHQTAFTWKPYRELTAAKKWSSHHKINAHMCFDTDGALLLLHPFDAYLWTANAFNPSCLSFEIMGNFEGLLGTGSWYKPDKFGRARPKRIQLLRARQMTKWLMDPTQGPSDDQLPAILLDWRKSCAALGGSPITWVNPHRGATNDRSNDCGSECWYHIAEHTFATYPRVSEGPLAGEGEATPAQWRSLPVVPPLP